MPPPVLPPFADDAATDEMLAPKKVLPLTMLHAAAAEAAYI
jgi:hypothetical protein